MRAKHAITIATTAASARTFAVSGNLFMPFPFVSLRCTLQALAIRDDAGRQ